MRDIRPEDLPAVRSYADVLAWEQKREEDQLRENLSSHPTTWGAATYGIGRNTYPSRS